MSLHTRYRPTKWADLIGQEAAAKSIEASLQDPKGPKAFMLSGPPGVGKTTIARLIARQLDVDPDVGGAGYEEIDAAAYNTVPDARKLRESVQLLPLGGGWRIVCLDEAHRITAQAWDVLLKAVEEPPTHVFWVFCTTEPKKVRKAIRDRCEVYELRTVNDLSLRDLLDSVVQKEGISLDGEVFGKVVEAAQGSPRRLLTGLEKVRHLTKIEDVDRVLEDVGLESDPDVADFCRALGRRAGWGELCKIIKRMENPSAEGIRAVVCSWYAKVALGASDERKAQSSLAILDAFGTPYPPHGSSVHPLLLSMGTLFLGGGE